MRLKKSLHWNKNLNFRVSAGIIKQLQYLRNLKATFWREIQFCEKKDIKIEEMQLARCRLQKSILRTTLALFGLALI
jgi:hypothetical protein